MVLRMRVENGVFQMSDFSTHWALLQGTRCFGQKNIGIGPRSRAAAFFLYVCHMQVQQSLPKSDTKGHGRASVQQIKIKYLALCLVDH